MYQDNNWTKSSFQIDYEETNIKVIAIFMKPYLFTTILFGTLIREIYYQTSRKIDKKETSLKDN